MAIFHRNVPWFSFRMQQFKSAPLEPLQLFKAIPPIHESNQIHFEFNVTSHLSANPSGLESSNSGTLSILLKHHLLSFGDLASIMTTIQKPK